MITSRQNNLVKEVQKLHTKKHRLERGAFLVEGEKLFNEAVKSGYELLELYSTTERAGAVLINDSVLKAMATTVSPQNLIAVFRKKETSFGAVKKCIILDNIQDPSNMGSIVRSALGAGFMDIIAVNCVDKYEPKVIRSSMGAVFHTNVFECNETQAMEIIKNNDLALAICSMEGESMFETDFPDNIAFVLGNEGNGVSEYFRKLAKLKLSIPMNEQLESLNVAVSSAILMYFYKYKKE